MPKYRDWDIDQDRQRHGSRKKNKQYQDYNDQFDYEEDRWQRKQQDRSKWSKKHPDRQ